MPQMFRLQKSEVANGLSPDAAPVVDQQFSEQIMARWQHDPAALVQILRDTQAHPGSGGWLSRPLLAHLARQLGLTLAHVLGVASFYRFFNLQPVGRYHLLFSDNITDRMLGNQALMARLCGHFGIVPGQLEPSGLISVRLCSCTGLCDQGPALLVNQHQVITRLDAQRVDALAALVKAQVPVAQWPAAWFEVEDNIRRADVLLTGLPAQDGQDGQDGSAAVMQALVQRSPQQLMDEVAASGLRGRGGAGFPTARKWLACRDAGQDGEAAAGSLSAEHALGSGAIVQAVQPPSYPLPRYVICNADEGEPGTFKDRVLLTRQADAVIGGMTVAARAITPPGGQVHGLIYLRGEYRYLLPHLQAVLARRRAAGSLGSRVAGIDGFDFDVAIHLGAGAYVCGEESALIESLEGKRGTPRIRPPFPVQHGYRGCPSIVNNVETYAAVAHIAVHGGAWWASIGTPQSTGTKIHSISGDCERPGLYEYPLGTPIATMLADCGARDAQAVQVGGPSGVCLPATAFARRIAFEDVPSAGALMVFDQRRDLFEVARHFARFFAHESCGLCTPCRVGTELVVRRLDKLAQEHGAGRGSAFDVQRLHELDELLHSGTHCGLGASACNPLRDTLRHFGQVYAQRTVAAQFEPEFDLDAELSSARAATGRDDRHAHLQTQGLAGQVDEPDALGKPGKVDMPGLAQQGGGDD